MIFVCWQQNKTNNYSLNIIICILLGITSLFQYLRDTALNIKTIPPLSTIRKPQQILKNYVLHSKTVNIISVCITKN